MGVAAEVSVAVSEVARASVRRDFISEVTGKQSPWPAFIRAACVFFNALCGVTNGYDICVTSAVLADIVFDLDFCGVADHSIHRRSQDITHCPRKQAIMSTAALGSLIAKLTMPWIADRFGRRASLIFVDMVIGIAISLEALATGPNIFLAGRFFLGMAMGLAFIVEPTYICEIAPADRRGQYVVMNEVAVCIGCLIGLQVGTAFERSHDHGRWRQALLLGAAPAVLQFFFVFLLPESPRWLAMQADLPGLERSCRLLGLPQEEVDGLRQIAREACNGNDCSSKSQSGVIDRFKAQQQAYSKHGRRFVSALMFSFFVPASGIGAMQAYSADIFRACGVEDPMRLLPLVGVMKLCGALIGVVGADAKGIGRKRLAACGSAISSIALLAIASRTMMPDIVPARGGAAAMLFFFIAWNAGYGSLQFVAVLEILPNSVRTVWAGQIYAICGIIEILIYQLFETMLVLNASSTFLFFAFVNLGAMIFACFGMSDLQGRSLESSIVESEASAAKVNHRADAAVANSSAGASRNNPNAAASADARSRGASRRQPRSASSRVPARRYGKLEEIEEEPEAENAQEIPQKPSV